MSYKPKSAGHDIKQGEEQRQQSHEESYELLSLDKTGIKHAYVNIYTLKSVMQGQCIDRPLTGTKLYTQKRAYEQLARGCYSKMEQPRIELITAGVASPIP